MICAVSRIAILFGISDEQFLNAYGIWSIASFTLLLNRAAFLVLKKIFHLQVNEQDRFFVTSERHNASSAFFASLLIHLCVSYDTVDRYITHIDSICSNLLMSCNATSIRLNHNHYISASKGKQKTAFLSVSIQSITYSMTRRFEFARFNTEIKICRQTHKRMECCVRLTQSCNIGNLF